MDQNISLPLLEANKFGRKVSALGSVKNQQENSSGVNLRDTTCGGSEDIFLAKKLNTYSMCLLFPSLNSLLS